MAFCEQCGNKLGDNAKFCGKCGTPVPAGQAEAPSTGTSGNGEDPALKAFNAGLASIEAEQYDEAIDHFTKAIRLNPNKAEFYTGRGLALSGKDSSVAAIANFTKSIQLRPDVAETYGFRGIEYIMKGELANASADLERGLEIDPGDETVIHLAELLEKAGRQGGVSAPTSCAQCGAPLEEGEAFCSNCGAKVGAAAQYRPAPVQAQRQAAGGHVEKHIIMMIEDVFLISGRGTVVTGKVENVVRLNEKVIIVGENFEKMSVVTGIEMFNKDLDKAVPGDNVGLFLKSIKKNEIKRGYYVKFAPNA